jgi:hypothetical protein
METLTFQANVQRLQAIASDDETRQGIIGVRIDRERNVAVATNGHMLAIVPLGDTTNVPEGTYRFTKAKPTKEVIQSGVAVFTNQSERAEEVKAVDVLSQGRNGAVESVSWGDYPNYAGVLTDAKNYVIVTLNTKYLYDLAQALNDPSGKEPFAVTLQIPTDANCPMYVSTKRHDGPVAALMPMHFELNQQTPLERIKKLVFRKPEAVAEALDAGVSEEAMKEAA